MNFLIRYFVRKEVAFETTTENLDGFFGGPNRLILTALINNNPNNIEIRIIETSNKEYIGSFFVKDIRIFGITDVDSGFLIKLKKHLDTKRVA